MTAALALADIATAPTQSAPSESYEMLRADPAFAEIPDDELMLATGRRDVEIRRFCRDDVLADARSLAEDGARIFVVLRGQAAVGVFEPEILADERAWAQDTSLEVRAKKIRPQGPLIELSHRNLATFEAGGVFNSRAIAADPDRTAFFAVTPVAAIAARPEWIGKVAPWSEHLSEQLARAIGSGRARLDKMTGSGAGIVDFYVRQGLSVAGKLRVLQIDRCIECLQCERACAARYGHKRLSIQSAPRLGRLAFVQTCRTCVDQRCLDPCNFDSIERDPDSGEIVIHQGTCTGCASCATACPYGAIDMVRLDDRDNRGFKARLLASGALASGRGTARPEAPELIASKCDHCEAYADQACISHCPTGALVELTGPELFDGMSPGPFQQGSSLPREQETRPRRRIRAGFLWFLGLLGFAGALAEILLRWLAPEYSVQYTLWVADGLEPAIAKLRVGFLPGSSLSRWLGYTGTALMALCLLYPLRKRFRPLYWIATGGAWFDLHVIGGTIGPLLILLHSAFHLSNWVAIGLWAFVATIISGVVGRYLYTQMHERFQGQSIMSIVHGADLRQLGAAHPDSLLVLERAVKRYREWAHIEPASVGFLRAVAWLLGDAIAAPFSRTLWVRRLRRTSAPRKIRRRMIRHVTEMLRQERRRGVALRFEGFFKSWLRIHVMFTLIAVVVTAAHIVTALTFSM